MSVQDPAGAARQKALRWLARREHSRRELEGRLRREGFDPEVVAGVLEGLAAEGWQSDARFAESLARSRESAGHGPLRIRRDLRQAGVAAELEEGALAGGDDRWVAQARVLLERRFGATPPADLREWQRRARYLAGRGFPEGVVRRALGTPDQD